MKAIASTKRKEIQAFFHSVERKGTMEFVRKNGLLHNCGFLHKNEKKCEERIRYFDVSKISLSGMRDNAGEHKSIALTPYSIMGLCTLQVI